MEVENEENEPSTYFFEQLTQNVKDKIRVDVDSVKNILYQQRRAFRETCGRKKFLENISTSNFDSIYNTIEIELKQQKEKHKKIKEEYNHKKESKHRTRRDNEKLISEIFKLKQNIYNTKLNINRLNSESFALKNTSKKKLILNKYSSYDINSLIDENQCKNIINNQNNRLNNINNNINNKKLIFDKNKQMNIELNKKNEIITKKLRSFKHLNSLNLNNNKNTQTQFIKLQKQLKSIQKLLGILVFEFKGNILCIQYENNGEIYKINIQIEIYENNENEPEYGIKQLEIMNGNGTGLNDICEWIMSKNNCDNSGLIRVRIMVIKRVIIEILLCLKRLQMRYNNIKKLFDIYGGNDGMLPWLPENGQLVFKFSFKQKLKDFNDINELDMDVPLVINVCWNYPQNKFIFDDCVVKIEHYNCSLRRIGNGTGVDNDGDTGMLKDIEGKWKEQLERVVKDVKGRFQNDIVGFVNFIYEELKRFGDIEQ